jgi:para-nitrobenzyl esterase
LTTSLNRREALAAGAAGAACVIPGFAFAATSDVSTRCPAGEFVGERAGSIGIFRGIRYGRASRFQPPVPVPPQRDAVSARDFGPACPQHGKYRPQDEDCLFLNIWTPAPGRAARLPVMLYIHGGAYANGSVTDPWNDGRHLAARGDVVVVTVNHRLNALGYLYLAGLDPRFADSGNSGQLDLVLALRWVRRNIAAFGGDPDRVMLFGQSGGGAKIATLLGMPAAKGLFQRAATMSGQQVALSRPVQATARARAFIAKLGVGERDLSPLLTMPVEHLLDGLRAEDPLLGGPVYMGPVLDGRSLLRHPFVPDANPLSRNVPMMLGTTHDETRGFIDPNEARTLDWSNLAGRIAAELPVAIPPDTVVAAYRRHEPHWSPAEIFYAATTAGRSWRPQVIEAEARVRAGAPTWVYQVDFTSRVQPELGAFHASDIPLVFGTLDAPQSPTGTGSDARAAARAMQDRFVAFAIHGDPNKRRLPEWPRYDLATRATMIFDSVSRVERDPRDWQRALFAPYAYTQPGT